MDYLYYYIRFLQKIIETSNRLEKKLINNKKINLNGNEKILIIKGDRIGDAVWCVWFVKILKANFPNIDIDIVVNKYNEFVFRENQSIINNLFVIDEKPPKHLVKNIIKIFPSFRDPFGVFFRNINFWKKLKKTNYNYIFNLTGRKYFFVSKYLGKTVGGRFGLFNIIYDYPLIGHSEIGSKEHVVNKWLNIINNIDFIKGIKNIQQFNGNKILLFIGGKEPGKLNDYLYKIIFNKLKNQGFQIDTLDDVYNPNVDYILEKDQNGFVVNNINLKDFLRNYHLFVGIDGGLLHYVSQYLPTISFYLSTNHKIAYPFYGQLLKSNYIDNSHIFYTNYGKNMVISSNIKCVGCFKIGCKKKICKNSLDKKTEMFINEIVNFANY